MLHGEALFRKLPLGHDVIGEKRDFGAGQRWLLHDGDGDGILAMVVDKLAVADKRRLIHDVAQEQPPENRRLGAKPQRLCRLRVGRLHKLDLVIKSEVRRRNDNQIVFLIAAFAAESAISHSVVRKHLQHHCHPLFQDVQARPPLNFAPLLPLPHDEGVLRALSQTAFER